MTYDELRMQSLTRLTATIDQMVQEEPAVRQIDFVVIAYGQGFYSWSTTGSQEETRRVLGGVLASVPPADEVTLMQ